jgi:hypothetical protein
MAFVGVGLRPIRQKPVVDTWDTFSEAYPGVKADLDVLSQLLVKETPVFCHDYRSGRL